MAEHVGVVFSEAELWLLHACIRHELAQQEQWKYPPASLDLNEQIGAAILFCVENGASEAALDLDLRACLAIDFTVRTDMKSPAGVPLGRAILLKTFAARRALAGGFTATAEEPALTGEQCERLSHLKEE